MILSISSKNVNIPGIFLFQVYHKLRFTSKYFYTEIKLTQLFPRTAEQKFINKFMTNFFIEVLNYPEKSFSFVFQSRSAQVNRTGQSGNAAKLSQLANV